MSTSAAPPPSDLAIHGVAADDPRAVILSAAEARFWQFGFRKTTVAEIARDANMSPANLYRYFENKQQIGAACCDRWMSERLEKLRGLVRRRGLTATERLGEFILENLKITHDLATKHPHIEEMVENITSMQPAMVHRKVDAMVALFAEILAYGNETGEFQVEDVIATARTVYSAQILFEVPIFAHLYPYEHFEAMARETVALLVRGLASR